ncbi:modification methylase [Scytonema hofmannii PCC 7110]|uniref:site-specific DNA-methyltransferase (cytosine-N(4)-specific) n=1 Tax=Scytonema hofmannii PCC 7110 TaxID=128403 RepID=A0A139X6U7_9CYAN|nr:modification methylase [Scytonema hofmannii PCC 7110]
MLEVQAKDATAELEQETNPVIQEIRNLDSDLENYFQEKIKIYPDFTRKIVSFQANKENPKYRWFKYKEAFSDDLVKFLLQKYKNQNISKVLDPFAGIGTTLFACNELGIDADGIELLPIGQEVIDIRLLMDQDFPKEYFEKLIFWKEEKPWKYSTGRKPLNRLRITDGAYPANTEEAIEKYLYLIEQESLPVQKVLKFALLCILESISYTRKDGQYLRWDARAKRKNSSENFDKGKILAFDEAIASQIELILNDTFYLSNIYIFPEEKKQSQITLLKGSCLKILPNLAKDSYDCVITSPPYCNRYDYTRTYALELALLGIGEQEIVQLRQDMLSCTVENKEKPIISKWQQAIKAADNQKLLQSILEFLNTELKNKKLNNSGIPRMIRGYFYEMACVIAECYRIMKSGAPLFMVNDNVRYAGVEISVDIILSAIAEQLGFDIEAILVLPIGKGNSSQQMGSHGRKPLRKCVYVWRKH